MELLILSIVLFVICFVASLLIFYGRKDAVFDTDVNELLLLYKSEIKRVRDVLADNNRKIDIVEKNILNCKKKLKMKLFNN